MSDWIINKYISMLSFRLHNFKKKSNNLYNFSCPFPDCNDLKAHPYQGRGYIYEKSNKHHYFCHYCTKSMSAENFIKSIDQSLYDQYVMEKLKENGSFSKPIENSFSTNQNFFDTGPLKKLKKVSQLSHHDFAKKYILSRKIPNEYHSRIYSCPNFMRFVNQIIPNKFSEDALVNDERRIVIPFFDKEKNIHAFQGRSLRANSKVKYITIILDETKPKIYGLDNIDYNQDIIVTEAVFDSIFLSNSIASAGGDIVSACKTLPKDKVIICYDNEQRSNETKKKLEKAILNGYKVCIWPKYIEEKDINEMIINEMKSEQIESIIKQNTFSDLTAKLKLSEWSNC